MQHVIKRFWIRVQWLLLSGVMGLAGCQTLTPSEQLSASSKLAEPGARCPPGADASDETLAAALGMDPDRLDRLHKLRYLSNRDICDLPAKVLQRAIAKVDSRKPDHPGEWAAFRAKRKADENGVVKPDGLIKGIEQRKAMLAAQAAAQKASGREAPPLAGISPTGWTAIGPGNIGGRIRSILIHPTQTNKMWVGSVSGGIWASTDSGASWNPVNDFMGNLSISSLVMDPASPNVIYAGTGEGCAGPGRSRPLPAPQGQRGHTGRLIVTRRGGRVAAAPEFSATRPGGSFFAGVCTVPATIRGIRA